MNYCRRCQSDYEKPGTCNCYAQHAAPLPEPVFVPSVPSVWTGAICARCGTHYFGTSHICATSVTITTTPWEGTVWFDSYGLLAGTSCNLAGCGGHCGICRPSS